MKKIFINGIIHTFNKTMSIVEAVVVSQGRIIDLGTTKDMLLQSGRAENEVINLNYKVVTPGLIDSHLHISGVAMNYLNLDLSGIYSKDKLLNIVKNKGDTLSKGEWLLGRGWDENLFKNENIPTIQELDSIVPHVPLFLTRICGHAFLINSKGLEMINFHPNMTVPEGGSFALDNITQKPTGLVIETASELVKKHIPSYSYEEMKGAIRKALQLAMSKGLTSVHTNDTENIGNLATTYNIYDELINKEDISIRPNLLINHEYLDDLKEFGMYTGYGNDKLQIGAIKTYADGAIGARTAYLSEPYSDFKHEYGKPMFDQDTLYQIISESRKLNMPVAIHTIGDKALENVLDLLDLFPPLQFRDRLIHVQVLNDQLIKRLALPHRCADIQPRFLASDFPWVQDRLGSKRIKKSYAWNSLLKSGVICSGGSDAPVEPINPLLGIHAAVTRKSPNKLKHDGYNAKEKISMYDAFRLFTEFGAYPTNEETVKGTLERGKYADMTVYSNDPFSMKNYDELLETDIVMTIMNGEIGYRK